MHSCYSLDFLNLWTFFFWSFLLLLSLFLYLFSHWLYSPAPIVCLILFSFLHTSQTPIFLQWLMISFEHCIPMMSSATSVMTELKLVVCISVSSSSVSSRANFLLMFAWKAFKMSGSFQVVNIEFDTDTLRLNSLFQRYSKVCDHKIMVTFYVDTRECPRFCFINAWF